MSLFKRPDPTVHPAPGTPVLPPQDVWAALYAVNQPGLSYVIRDGSPEGVDLVAQFQKMEVGGSSLRGRRQSWEEFQIWMRLDPPNHQVRSIDHLTTYDLILSDPPRRRTTGRSSGQLYEKYASYERTRTPDGRHKWVTSSSFDSKQVKHTLQQVVLATGWSWHPLRTGHP